MRKFLIFLFGILVALILVGMFAWNMMPTWISHKLSEKAKVPVSIQAIHIGTNSVKVDRIRVGNPPNSILPRALMVKKLIANVPFMHFFEDRIVINEMKLKDVYVGLELNSPRSSQGNWTEIMANLKASTNEDKRQAKAKGETKSVLIKKLIITDLQIDLAFRSNGRVRRLRKIDRIELDNISSEGGLPTAQIMDIIMSEMLREIFSPENIQNMLENFLSPEGGRAESAIQGLKGLFSTQLEEENNWDHLYSDAQ